MAKSNGLSIKIDGQLGIQKNISYLRRNFPDWLQAANRATAEEIQSNAEANILKIDAYDTGELHESIVIKESRGGLAVAVGSTAKHAPFIEFGTAPHFPPLAPIRAWCERKGIPIGAAFPIARKIAERGTPARPFLAPAFKSAKSGYIAKVKNFCYLGMQGVLK